LSGKSREKPGVNSLQRKKSESYWKVLEEKSPLLPFVAERVSMSICITTGVNPF
jgi:hypothetical protein